MKTRDVPISFWPIIGQPVISTKQSADYRSTPINGFSPILRMITLTILWVEIDDKLWKLEIVDLA